MRHRHSLHEMAVGTVAENRWYGGQFLLEAADHVHYSQIEDLFVAAARLAAEHDLMWQVWDAAGGNGNPTPGHGGPARRPPQDRPADPGRAGEGYGCGGASGACAGAGVEALETSSTSEEGRRSRAQLPEPPIGGYERDPAQPFAIYEALARAV